MRDMPPSDFERQRVAKAVAGNTSMAAVLRALGRPVAMSGYRYVRGLATSMNLDLSHLEPRNRKREWSCATCGAKVWKGNDRCRGCYESHGRGTKIDWPPTDELRRRVEASSFSAVARELGVSDNAIRKRLRNH
jgi:hypothetical protein